MHHTRYEASMRALQEVILAMQGGQWETAMELYAAAKSQWLVLKKNNDLRCEIINICFSVSKNSQL